MSPIILARGSAKLIEALFRGDPVAWVILGGVVGVMILFYCIRAWLNTPSPPPVYPPQNRPDYPNFGGGYPPQNPPAPPDNPYAKF